MACSTCNNTQSTSQTAIGAFNATDLTVVDANEVREFADTDWPTDKHKLVIFFPETHTPVCKTEQEPLLSGLGCLTFSSYLLPTRLGLIENGRAKRASVFIMKDGTVVKQEHFPKVGRSFVELHRMLYGYTTESYCAEGWTSPADGDLNAQ